MHFKISTLSEILDGNNVDRRLKEIQRTNRSWKEGLIEGYSAVFLWNDGKHYKVEFRRASEYFTATAGEYVAPFDHIRGDTIEAVEVTPEKVLVTVYKAV